jgi:O-antigen biosynthesis protein
MNNPIKSQKLILVLGMHGSGTHAITRGLTTMGVTFENCLMASAPDVNDIGSFEVIDFVSLNDEMLRTCAREWYSLEPLHSADVDLLFNRGYLQKAIKLLRNKIAKYDVFCLNDPCTVTLLPFWSRVFSMMGIDVHYVVAVRNPMGVSHLIKESDHFSAAFAYVLWIHHTLSCLAYLQNRPKIIVDYDQLTQSPQTELPRMAQWLGVTVNQDALDLYQNSFLASELRHQLYSLDEMLVDTTVPKLAKEIYSFLSKQSKNQTACDQSNEEMLVQTWFNAFASMPPMMRLLDQQNGQILEQALASQKQTKLIDELQHAIFLRNIEIEALNHSLNKQVSELKEAHANQHALINSHSWRLTLPLREIKLWLLSPRQQAKRYLSAVLRISKIKH